MFNDAYLTECNIEVAHREIDEVMNGKTSLDRQVWRLSFAFSCDRYHSIMLECHGGI